MKAESISVIKKELNYLNSSELIQLLLQLSKYKKDNKELLSYLMFEESNEPGYINGVKEEVDSNFESINTSSYFFIKKSVRKILRLVKKYIKYSTSKETEVELMLYFCYKLNELTPPMEKDKALHNIFLRQLEAVKKSISKLHEDLQYDYNIELQNMLED